MVDVDKLGMLIGELRGDLVGGDVECAGQLIVRAGDEATAFPELQVLSSDSTGPGESGCESSSASRDLAAAW